MQEDTAISRNSNCLWHYHVWPMVVPYGYGRPSNGFHLIFVIAVAMPLHLIMAVGGTPEMIMV